MRQLAFLLALAAPAAAQAQPAAPAAARDWAAQVEVTAEGGWRMGNPNAPKKLVEYGSVTCSHCAEFDAAAGPAIRNHVRTGRVSFEYRPFIIFPSDPGLFLLLRCQAPERFFATLQSLYTSQATWVAALEARQAEIEAAAARGSFLASLPVMVRVTGTDRLFRQNGLDDRQIAACLSDSAAMQRLTDIHQRGIAQGVQGTPTLMLNGRPLELAAWSDLDAALRQP